MLMVRLNVNLENNFYSRLKELPGTVSENVRFALIEYLKTKKVLDTASSQSKVKEGDINE